MIEKVNLAIHMKVKLEVKCDVKVCSQCSKVDEESISILNSPFN